MEKYKIIEDEFIDFYGRKLYRIVRIVDNVKGGFIESIKNLSQDGNAWVYGNAEVYGNAKVSGNAKVYGNAKVSGDAIIKNIKIEKTVDYIIYGPIGSRDAFVTICKEQNKILTGCFCGDKKEFLEAVQKTHSDNKHAQDYIKLIDFIFN